MMKVEVLSRLIREAYGAAYGANSWERMIASLNDAYHGSRACILANRLDSAGAVRSVDHVAATADDQAFNSGDVMEEMRNDRTFWPFYGVNFAAAIAGQFPRWSDVAEDLRWRRSDFFHKWMRPRDMFEHYMCTCDNRAQTGAVHSFILSRGRKQGRLDADETKSFLLLQPHIRQALEISEILHESSSLHRAVNALPFGLLIVEKSGRVRRLNNAADKFFSRMDAPVAIRGGMLVTTSPADSSSLAKLIAAAFGPMEGEPPPPSLVLSNPRADSGGRNRLVVSAAPMVDGPFEPSGGDPCAIVIMRAVGEEVDQAFASLLARMFGLSPAHARLAVRLTSGMSLKDAGAANGISYASARTYLEIIFQKTGARRQAELVALLKSVELSCLG